jgi:hypothetical protein
MRYMRQRRRQDALRLPPPHAPSDASEAAQSTVDVAQTKRASRIVIDGLPSMEEIGPERTNQRALLVIVG